ncbi:hypothetical protein [Candidatus Coxiella mudrowiae]|uniref:hypothetical protein n=1 Tax=Candidatus Coxiella mudrowiae TaxID=2054173 RepID=UPI000662C2B4|nr:hypothetical protein [Candidatus Coxiella mudrowiae]
MAQLMLLIYLDPPLKRLRRFDKIIKVPLPNHENRRALVEFYLSFTCYNTRSINDEFMEEFASDLEGYSSQYIKHLVNKAQIFGVKSHATAINRNQILKAIRRKSIRRFKEHNTNATQSLQDIYAPRR